MPQNKLRINITIDESVYFFLKNKKVKVSTLTNYLLIDYISKYYNSPLEAKTRVRIPVGALSLTSDIKRKTTIEYDFKSFLNYLKKKEVTERYIKDTSNKVRKCVFCYPLFSKDNILKNYEKINEDGYLSKGIRLLSKYLRDNNLIDNDCFQEINSKIKIKKFGVDNYVPTTTEIIHTLNHIPDDKRDYYLIVLFSGIRVTELKYMLHNLSKLRISTNPNFQKIELNYFRSNKKSFFIYLPLFIDLKKLDFKFKITNLTSHLKKHNLVHLKYLRKWFYTTCITLGIPDSIADYYEGRTSNSVGANHYLGKQALADKYYSEKLIDYFKVYIYQNIELYK